MIPEARKAQLAEHCNRLHSKPFGYFNSYGRLRTALEFELNLTWDHIRQDRKCLWSYMSDWVEEQKFTEEQADEIVASRRKCAGIAMMLFLTFKR